MLCCTVSLRVIGPLAIHFKLGWAGWIVGLPLGFFGCFGFFQGLFAVAGVVGNRFRADQQLEGILPLLLHVLAHLLPHFAGPIGQRFMPLAPLLVVGGQT